MHPTTNAPREPPAQAPQCRLGIRRGVCAAVEADDRDFGPEGAELAAGAGSSFGD